MTADDERKPLLAKDIRRRSLCGNGSSLYGTEKGGEELGPGDNLSQDQILYPYIFRRAISQDSIFRSTSHSDKLMESPASGKPEEVRCEESIKRQSSIVTIFAIWNTMMGTSLLAMPWGIGRAGLILGPILTVIMGGLCLFTAYCNLRAHRQFGTPTGEISELTHTLLGKTSEIISKIFSFIVLLGANIVYWILMTNFLFHSVDFVYSISNNVPETMHENVTVLSGGVFCPKQLTLLDDSDKINDSLFKKIWSIDLSVPIFLVLIVGPLLNFKSPTFFTKFNSLGTLSVAYLLTFVFTKSATWGINIDINNPQSSHYSPLVTPSFPATSGMLALSYFIHNIIITVMKSNANQKNNARDLSISYTLVTLTYVLIGTVFYVSFPLAKSCIQDNLLNNFVSLDTMTVIGRVFLLFQLITVYPLITYMLRVQTMIALTGRSFPSRLHVIGFNTFIVGTCIFFAIFLPRIGTIIRFTGALSGLIHIFALPCLIRLATLYKSGTVKTYSLIVYSAIPLFGAANLLGQFFVFD